MAGGRGPPHEGGRLNAFDAAVIETRRFRLTPLRVDDADELAAILADERLHEFTGGRPLDAADLRARYERLVAGSLRTDELWRNWIVRRRDDGRAVATVQATVSRTSRGWSAEAAWIVTVPWQGQGVASEAAAALVEWLLAEGAFEVVAHIHPAHVASAAVAARAGLERTDDDEVEGEQVWRRVAERVGAG